MLEIEQYLLAVAGSLFYDHHLANQVHELSGMTPAWEEKMMSDLADLEGEIQKRTDEEDVLSGRLGEGKDRRQSLAVLLDAEILRKVTGWEGGLTTRDSETDDG